MANAITRHGRARGLKTVRPFTVAAGSTFKIGDFVTLVAAGTIGDMLVAQAAGDKSVAGTKILGMAMANAADFLTSGAPMYQRLCPVRVATEDTEFLLSLATSVIATPATTAAVAWNADYVTTWATYGQDVTPTYQVIARNGTTGGDIYYVSTDATAGMCEIANVVYNAIQNHGTNQGRPVVSDNYPDVWVRFPAARRLGA